jgi:hypothetical protein
MFRAKNNAQNASFANRDAPLCHTGLGVMGFTSKHHLTVYIDNFYL